MIFHDAHSHRLLAQAGGLFIGLEGQPVFADTITNAQAFALEDKSKLRFAVEYVTQAAEVGTHPLLKYHPRREHYSPPFVVASLRRSRPQLCVIDTLNQPFWQPLDYWGIAREFREIQFIFCHAGGYDILDFLKMADFTPNVWLDFSLTQEYFGWAGPRPKLRHVSDCIDYGLQFERIKRKVLFGSDEPFFSQSLALERYLKLPDQKLFLTENYVALLQSARLI
jgi:predicted TIM-barrel fold metal-dependent hydrolase